MDASLDPELWHACAGGMVQMPPVNSEVFYFPQGHAEHTLTCVDFGKLGNFPPMILCRVEDVRYLADPETDEVYAKIRLVPGGEDTGFEDDSVLRSGAPREKPSSFAKTLTQSDANNGGGFSVPRYCAETIFPRLDYAADPPVQNIAAKDVHGETWRFRHIYRGTPRRHLLTTGWSTFVNHKKLVAGDSIVFMKAENGDLWVGIRRAKKSHHIGGSENISPSWNSGAGGCFSTFSSPSFLKDASKVSGNIKEKVCALPESVAEAIYRASNGQPFEVEFYPRANTPEFCVRASSVRAAMRIQWCPGIRFKMPFETEDSSRISWFMGTVASVQASSDALRFRNSPWRLLQVSWDEPDLLQNVSCVNPWLVEIVSGNPVLHLSPSFPQPRKKLRPPLHSEFPFGRLQFPLPSFSGTPLVPISPLCVVHDTISAGIQGARQAQVNLNFGNELQMGVGLPPNFFHLHPRPDGSLDDHDNVSCTLSIGNGNSSHVPDKTDDFKTARFVLFGQPILTEQQMSLSNVGHETEIACGSEELSKSSDLVWKTDAALDTDHCKVFLDSEDVGRSIDLSGLGSFEELYQKLEDMFALDRADLQGNVLYRDAAGAVKPVGLGDEPFSEFANKATRLTILTKQTVNGGERKLITGLAKAARGLDSSNQAGPLSIFA